MTVLVPHDRGCRYARLEHGGHSDAAKRLSDTYNLHRAAGTRRGFIAVRLADGGQDDPTVYDDRAAAVGHCWPYEDRYAYIQLIAPSMTVCEAESVMRFQRQAHGLQRRHTDRDARGGGLQVIPRLTIEDQERQLAALAGFGRLPVALGYAKE